MLTKASSSYRHTFTRNLSTTSAWAAWENMTLKSSANNQAVNPIANSYLGKILTSEVYEAAHETPLTYAANLSASMGNNMYLKREDTQPVFSFKIRGAYNKIAKLSPELRERGVVTCSAGNHAQGVALSAAKLGISAIIVMPLATPAIKVNAVRRFGGPTVTVKLHGQNYDEAAAEAKRLVAEKGLTMVHPFDDPDVISGQGTIGMEIIKKMNGRSLDVVFACVGGGGLLSGVAAYIKALRPEVKVIGVEADDAPGMTESLRAGKVTTLPQVGLFADGAAVKTVGTETFEVCRQLVDGMITVKTDEICAAIKLGFNDTRCVLEPAGALAIAGMVKYSKLTGCKGKTLIAVSSGANMDFDRLRFVSERADSSECLMAVGIPERPGSFRQLYSVLYPRNVTEFSYRHNNSTKANVFVSFQALPGKTLMEDKITMEQKLKENGYTFTDLSDNEMAKAHARHLSGGRREDIGFIYNSHGEKEKDNMTELLFRFEFPEAPGALDKFLSNFNQFNQGWSISLFHYRNHGHDFGRVLVGALVHEGERAAFDNFLDRLGYTNYEETNNIAYTQFLK